MPEMEFLPPQTYSNMGYPAHTSNIYHMKEDCGKSSSGEMKLGRTHSRQSLSWPKVLRDVAEEETTELVLKDKQDFDL